MVTQRTTDYKSETLSRRRFGAELLDDEAFGRLISLERKRTERSHKLFLLMLLDLEEFLLQEKGEKVLQKLLSTISREVRETDTTGWYKNGGTVGIIFTEIASEGRHSVAAALLARVSGILYRNLTFEQYNGIAVSHFLFPEEWDHDVPQRPSHPTLYPDLTKRENDTKRYVVAKRAADVIGSSLLLLLGSWVFLLIALYIKCSSRGPVLFRQVRVGQFGEPFVFLKFRSMHADNDPAIHERYVTALIAGKAERHSMDKTVSGIFKLAGDPRVTYAGKFLRKTSLDELPQLLNVLKGDMSLVGPRPAIPYEVQAYDFWHRRRVLEAKPGITGLWQVKGRSRVTFDEMVRLDVRYATERSLWLDLSILLRTPRAVILGSGAC